MTGAPIITAGWWAVGQAVLVPPARLWKRLSVSGQENLADDGAGGLLVVSNHISQTDPPLVGVAARPRRLYYMTKSELFSIPVLSAFISRLGAFPVRRGEADRDAIRTARILLARGEAVLMFPEGTRYKDGVLRPPLPGAGALALAPGVRVVPAAIWGSRRAFGPVRVVFGPPRDLTDVGGGSRTERAKAAADEMMRMIGELLPAAGAPGPRGNG